MDKKTIRIGIITGSIFLLLLNGYLYINDISLISNNGLIAQQLVGLTGSENSLHKIISILVGFVILIAGLFFWNKNKGDE